MIELVHRAPGWQWPLREHHYVDAWEGMQLVAEFPGELVRQMIAHYLMGAEIQGRIQGFLRRPPAAMELKAHPPRLLGVNGRPLRGFPDRIRRSPDRL